MTGTIDRPDSVGTQGDGAELARRPPNGGNPKSVNRRRALRMMGTAAVGAAGAVALNGALPSAVEAASGETFILGAINNADGDFTSLTSSNVGAALSVEATAVGANAILGQATNPGGGVGVQGSSVNGTGVYGQHGSSEAPGVGVAGYSNMGPGVLGSSAAGAGLSGLSTAGHGVIGTGTVAGVRGEGGTSGIGVEGIGTGSAGVSGQSANGVGVSGETAGLLAVHAGVRGRAAPLQTGPNAPYPTPIGGNGNAGVQGLSGDGIGVLGMNATNQAAVRGIALGSGQGVRGESWGGVGGYFQSGNTNNGLQVGVYAEVNSADGNSTGTRDQHSARWDRAACRGPRPFRVSH